MSRVKPPKGAFINDVTQVSPTVYATEAASERDSLTVSTLACHAADPGSNPAQGDDFFN